MRGFCGARLSQAAALLKTYGASTFCGLRHVGFVAPHKTISGAAEAPARFEFHEGDRVVLIGDTLIERETSYGYLEQRLSTNSPSAPPRHIIFRNLGWSADSARWRVAGQF